MSQYSLKIYRYFYENLPPLLSVDLIKEIEESLQGFEQEQDFELSALESEMVKYGYLVWPFHQAYLEFIEKAIADLGDHFLLPYLGEGIQEKYIGFKDYGVNWHDLYYGRMLDLFEFEEIQEISRALVQARKKIHQYVRQDIVGLTKDKYLERVSKYNQILEAIKEELEQLCALAKAEEDHPALADQIRSRIDDVEHSLCLLGKQLNYHEIINAKDFFTGRKEELNRLKGIDKPKKIDFYD